MSQITWRNINSDMSAYGGRALEGASRSFDSMFDKLTGAVARTQSIDDKNWENTKVNRTNDALNTIMGYGTPEAMAQAQKAGVLQTMLQGGQIDQQAVRSAFDTRMPELQKRVTQGFAYDNAVVDQRTAPMMEALRMAAINGDPTAQAKLQEYVAQGGRNGSQGAEFIDGRKQLGVTRERDTARFGFEKQDQLWQGEKHESDLLTSVVGRQESQNRMANDNASRKLAQDKFTYEKTKAEKDYSPGGAFSNAAIEKQYAALKENSALSLGTYNTKEGKTNLMRELKARGLSAGETDDILYNLSKYYSKGVPLTHDAKGKPVDRLSLPVSAVLDEVDRATENPLSYITPGWSRKGDATVNALDKRFGIDSGGNKNESTFAERDQDLVSEMLFMNKLDAERTAGLTREGQNKEIRNAPKGKGKKQK